MASGDPTGFAHTGKGTQHIFFVSDTNHVSRFSGGPSRRRGPKVFARCRTRMGRSNQKVNVVARHDVIKYRKTKALFRFKNPAQGMWIRSISSIGNRANSIPKRFERSEAVERLERFEPNVVGWRGIVYLRACICWPKTQV